MEFVLKGGRRGMIVPAGISLIFSLNNDNLDYFSVCEIQITDEPYFQLDTDSLTWKSITISNGGDRIISRSVIGSDLRCPHLLSDNIYNPELREYYMGYGLGTVPDECSTGFYDLHVELDNMTDIYSVMIWAFRLLNNSQCISTNKSMTVIMRKYSSDPGVLCIYRNKILKHDSLTVMYANCEPIITGRFITLRMSKDVFRHDLSNIVEVGIFGYIWQPSINSIIKLINISTYINESKSYLNITDIDTVTISIDINNSTQVNSRVVTSNRFTSTESDTDKPINTDTKNKINIRILIVSLLGTMALFTIIVYVERNRNEDNYVNVSISKGLVIPTIDCETEKEHTLVNNIHSGNSSRTNKMPTLKEMHASSNNIGGINI